MPWQVILLLLAITALVTVGYLIATELDKDPSAEDITAFKLPDFWAFARGVGGILAALAILVIGLAVVDLTTHGSTLGKHVPVLTGR